MRLRCAKVSVALPKIAMWRQPSSSARSRPRSLGTSTGRSRAASPGPRSSVHQLGRVGELGDPPRVHEAGRLDDRQAGGEQALDELGLGLDRDDALLVLQAVAGADLVDGDALGQPGLDSARALLLVHLASTSKSSAPRATWSPASAPTVVTVPANGALSASSIFIASSTPSRCPSSTASPSATSTASTVPGIGAVRLPSPTAAAGAGERVGPLEDEALAVDHHLDRVGGRVDDGLDAAAGDLEAHDVLLGRGAG